MKKCEGAEAEARLQKSLLTPSQRSNRQVPLQAAPKAKIAATNTDLLMKKKILEGPLTGLSTTQKGTNLSNYSSAGSRQQ